MRKEKHTAEESKKETKMLWKEMEHKINTKKKVQSLALLVYGAGIPGAGEVTHLNETRTPCPAASHPLPSPNTKTAWAT